jgi:hypothetical protein
LCRSQKAIWQRFPSPPGSSRSKRKQIARSSSTLGFAQSSGHLIIERRGRRRSGAVATSSIAAEKLGKNRTQPGAAEDWGMNGVSSPGSSLLK